MDDCSDQRDLYEIVLSADFTILTASRGAEAIAVAQLYHPDVIVLDIDMPEMDGFETCRRLKADPATAAIPVVMLTAHDHSHNAGRAVGALTVLQKPCSEILLAEAIAVAIIASAR
ncbi:MAG TPA: response regulator [Vicinamibacterales bacterium]|nr:response regulator [Vicinamibacterales bacterium]